MIFKTIEHEVFIYLSHTITQTLVQKMLQLLVIKLYAVARIRDANHPRTTTNLLNRTLCESGWIGETLMIEYVIEVDTRDAHTEAIKRNSHHLRHILFLSHTDVANLIIATCTTIIEVGTYLSTIDAEVKLLFHRIVANIKILQIEGIAKKYPSPTEIWASLNSGLGRQ